MRLFPLIETYWSASSFKETEAPVKILPDGCVDIIFTFDKTAGNVRSNIIGTMTTFIEVCYP
jgi:hypothetical protein